MHKLVNNLSLLVLLTASVAQAGELGSYLGALGGPAIGTQNATGTHPILGGRLGTTIGQRSGTSAALGLLVETLSNSQTASGSTVDGRLTLIMGELLARKLGGSGAYLGARAGIEISSVTVTSSTSSSTGTGNAFACSPVVGYEFALLPALSFDLDVSWVTILSRTITFPSGGAVTLDLSQILIPQAGLTLHF